MINYIKNPLKENKGKMYSTTAKISLILIFIIGIGSIHLLNNQENIPTFIRGKKINYPHEIERLQKHFNEKGSVETVIYFNKKYGSIENSLVHVLEHFLGAELYIRNGISGISLCIDSERAGCYHGFFIEAFKKEGIMFLSEVEKECKKKHIMPERWACMHGIGHGLMVIGTENNINKSLESCDRENNSEMEQIMCYTGVFMEYNIPSVHNGEINPKVLARKMLTGKEDGVCPSIVEKYKTWCYFELPMWWNSIFNNEMYKFDKITKLCETIDKDQFIEKCFERIGTIAITEPNTDKQTAKKQCEKSNIKKHHIYCYKGIAKSNAMANSENPTYLCDDLKQTKNICLSEITSGFNEIYDQL